MTLQDRLGDRAGALRTYEDLATRLPREFDAKPAAETKALADRIKTRRDAPTTTERLDPELQPVVAEARARLTR